MVRDHSELIAALIASEALRIAPAGELFWYTSGTVGPYYINTEYLFGGAEKARGLLAFIDEQKGDVPTLVAGLQSRCRDMYDSNSMYRAVIDELVALVPDAVDRFDLVSGGERRDWFFSVAVAAKLGLPHLYIYKDHKAYTVDAEGNPAASDDLRGSSALHVADLITEASSYAKGWVPALSSRGGKLKHALNVIDRAQGGAQLLLSLGVRAESLLRVDRELFATMLQKGLVDADQTRVLNAYYDDPTGAMRSFLLDNPGFLEQSLASSDGRTAQRARLLVDQNLYGLHSGP